MPASAPRIAPQLLEVLRRVDDPSRPIAETCRRIGAAADELGLTRPSYQRIRVLVHEFRRGKLRHDPSTASVLLDVATRSRPPDAIVDHLSGVGVTRRRT